MSCRSLGAEQCGSNARPPHPEHIGDIMLAFRSIRMWKNVLPLENHCLLVFFRDGAVKKCDLQKYFERTKAFQILLKKPDYFQHVQMQTGGYGVAWDVNMTVSDAMLYRIGKSVPLKMEDFRNFAAHRVINEILGCSQQNIIDLTKRGKLHPIKAPEKSTLYLKSEILKRNWQ